MRKTDWLQLFAQPEESARAGENAGDTAPDAGERQEDFEDLIRGRYKADFETRVRKILDGRLRGLRQEVTDLRQREKLRQLAEAAEKTLELDALLDAVKPYIPAAKLRGV